MADKLVHGPAAAALLVRDFAVDDPGLLEAVAFHTVGRPGMGELAVILYCADKLEEGRGRGDGRKRERILGLEPTEMLRATILDVMAWLERKGHAIAPETRLLYDSLSIEVRRE